MQAETLIINGTDTDKTLQVHHKIGLDSHIFTFKFWRILLIKMQGEDHRKHRGKGVHPGCG